MGSTGSTIHSPTSSSVCVPPSSALSKTNFQNSQCVRNVQTRTLSGKRVHVSHSPSQVQFTGTCANCMDDHFHASTYHRAVVAAVVVAVAAPRPALDKCWAAPRARSRRRRRAWWRPLLRAARRCTHAHPSASRRTRAPRCARTRAALRPEATSCGQNTQFKQLERHCDEGGHLRKRSTPPNRSTNAQIEALFFVKFLDPYLLREKGSTL